jgi:hypothetical protein
MSLSAFGDNGRAPSEDDLRATLGRAYSPWKKLVALVGERISPIAEVWAFTSTNTGWGLRIRHRDRIILYMTHQHQQFLVSLVLGEKAIAAARAARLSAAVRDAIAAAPRYAEGTGLRMTVTSSRQLPGLAALAQIKWQN